MPLRSQHEETVQLRGVACTRGAWPAERQYWLVRGSARPSFMASLRNSGGDQSGKPWPRLMAPDSTASGENSCHTEGAKNLRHRGDEEAMDVSCQQQAGTPVEALGRASVLEWWCVSAH